MSATQSLPDFCQPQTASDRAYEAEQAKIDALTTASKAMAAEMAEKFDLLVKDLGIDYGSLHMKRAERRSNNSAKREFATIIRDEMLEAIVYPDPDLAGEE